ncbi:MAG TPA: restriction endonuclease [Treponema sp.]|nr:restriction endonuclease [Treponema sp.]
MIPDFQSFMLPLLEFIGKNEEVPMKIVKEGMIKHFAISKEEQEQKTPNGKQYTYYNRIAWAISYLKMAELIYYPQRGIYKITEIGKGVLQNAPEKITIGYLRQFANFSKHINPEKIKNKNVEDTEQEISEKTPDELFELSYTQIISALKEQLKQKINECSPYFFEQIVLDLLLKMGYGGSEIDNGELTQKSADEGIDGIIKEDKLGLDKIYIQAKKWEKTVGRPEIQKFVGALHGKRAKKGVFITTSEFSKEAYEYAHNLDVAVILIDGEKLSQYMVENELGISLKHNFKIYAVDNDYFEE